jgi:hypothetical protein
MEIAKTTSGPFLNFTRPGTATPIADTSDLAGP